MVTKPSYEELAAALQALADRARDAWDQAADEDLWQSEELHDAVATADRLLKAVKPAP